MKLMGLLDKFSVQAHEEDLHTAEYPREWDIFNLKVSFGMGAPARVPWIGFTPPGQSVGRGINPVYLYYKDKNVLILAYGVGETEETDQSWPPEVINSTPTIGAYFDEDVPRYGSSFVFRAYRVEISRNGVKYLKGETKDEATEKDMEADLNTLLNYYKKNFMSDDSPVSSEISKGLFYMEKQLEDFLIHNWENTELGKEYELIIEDGELLSQQYKTDIGPIDILAKDKKNKNHVVIELKKDQTSDDTIGQITRYMGWIKENKKDNDVKGIIIAGTYDKRLEYALKMVSGIEVYLYKIDFTLSEFGGVK